MQKASDPWGQASFSVARASEWQEDVVQSWACWAGDSGAVREWCRTQGLFLVFTPVFICGKEDIS